MISKVVSARSFYHTCRYVCTKQGAEVLLVEGVRSHSYKVMAEDFTRQQGLRPTKKLACFHGILSFYPGEKLSDERMIEIAQRYLQRLGIVNTQYAVCKHSDRAHAHLHIVANLVDNEGRSIPDSYLGLKGKKIAQGLTREYGLIPAGEKNQGLTHLEHYSEIEATKYRIYLAITEVLPACRSIEELEGRLSVLGIETRYKFKGQSTQKQGISFKSGVFCFKGSAVDRRFSLAGLQKTLGQQQEIKKGRSAEVHPTVTQHRAQHTADAAQGRGVLMAAKGLAGGVKEALDSLLQPVNASESVPHELLKEQRQKKKKKSKGLGL